jgi:hypothetical protein
MPEDLEASARLAYDTYTQACQGRNAAGLPMPMWESVSVPERTAWMQVASAVTGLPLPEAAPAPGAPGTPTPALPYTREDLEEMTVTDLRELASAAALHVGSSSTKPQLIDALLASQRGAP